MRKKLGELLVEAKVIDDFQLQASLGHQRQWGGRIGEIIVNKGFASAESVADSLASQLGLSRFLLAADKIDPRAAGLVAKDLAERARLLPFSLEGDRGEVLWIAMNDPTDLSTLDELQFQTGKRLRVAVASEAEVHAAIAYVHSGTPLPQKKEASSSPLGAEETGAGPEEIGEMLEVEELEEVVGEPVSEDAALGGPSPAPTSQLQPESQAVQLDQVFGVVGDSSKGEPEKVSPALPVTVTKISPFAAGPVNLPKNDLDADWAALGLGSDEAPLQAEERASPERPASQSAGAPTAAPAGAKPVAMPSIFADGSVEALISDALEKLSNGEEVSDAAARYVNPTQMSAALIRLLIRKGLIGELEFIESLQEK